jgi:hypothetical protein
MSDSATSEHSEYYDAVTQADGHLDAVMAAIRADELADDLTPREAADNRIAALEAHLERVRALRVEHFGVNGP